MNRLSEKVYVSGLPSRWPKITRIPMLLANQIAGANRMKGDLYVLERGTSHNQSTNRCRFIAVAVATCWRWVFTKPRYRVRRIPNAKTACEMVPSTPARLLYRAVKSSVCCRWRAACRANCCACGCNVSSRGPVLLRVHRVRMAHPAQSFL
jgi:hypothetical protein